MYIYTCACVCRYIWKWLQKVNFQRLFTCFKSGVNKLFFFLSGLSPKQNEIFPELVTCALCKYSTKDPMIFSCSGDISTWLCFARSWYLARMRLFFSFSMILDFSVFRISMPSPINLTNFSWYKKFQVVVVRQYVSDQVALSSRS